MHAEPHHTGRRCGSGSIAEAQLRTASALAFGSPPGPFSVTTAAHRPGHSAESKTVTAIDWIAAAQALFLAVAAFFAWRSYRIAAEERRREPLRKLLLDVGAEVKAYMLDVTSVRQRARLQVALEMIPEGALDADLTATRKLANEIPAMGSPIKEWIEDASRELAVALRKLI
jgi:hypothetical protein